MHTPARKGYITSTTASAIVKHVNLPFLGGGRQEKVELCIVKFKKKLKTLVALPTL
jgi:hypothetical protein